MTRPIMKEHNLETDEVIERPMTDEEFAVYQADLAIELAAEAEKQTTLAQRQELLERLGITEEEAKLLLS